MSESHTSLGEPSVLEAKIRKQCLVLAKKILRSSTSLDSARLAKDLFVRGSHEPTSRQVYAFLIASKVEESVAWSVAGMGNTEMASA